MKKLAVLAGVLCFVFVSCCNKTEAPKEEGQCTKEEKHEEGCCKMTEEQKAECEAFRKQWDNWANLTDDAKKELVAKGKSCIDEKFAKMEAKIEACKADWLAFDNLDIEEQKALIDKKMQCGKKHCKNSKKQCEKKCEKKSEN
jgi:hypothetical protein